jgi:sulfur relay (sulfurtransferase) DsrC/TusE family protein
VSTFSQLGWVDFSSDDRERVKQVLSQLQEKGTLDELGIGRLRDAFADLLFPGFSTIQTRGKYLIIVPRIIRGYLSLKPAERKRQSLSNYLKVQEDDVVERLRNRHLEDDETGIIGIKKVESGGVARRPSSVYWGALRQWRIIETSTSLAQFCREITQPETNLGMLKGENESDDKDTLSGKHKVHLDAWVSDWLENIELNLTHSEASFLKEKMLRGVINSVPTQLFQHNLMGNALEKQYKNFPEFSAWLCQQSQVSEKTKETARLAQAFSELIYGAHIRFNCLLAERNQQHSRHMAHLKDWDSWVDSIQLEQEDCVEIWLKHTEVRLPNYTVRFLKAWYNAIRTKASVQTLDKLVEQQSKDNKKQRSILQKRLAQDIEWFGMSRLNYRWAQVQVILGDIQRGLEC